MTRKNLVTRNIYSALPRTTRGSPLVLGGDPKGKNFLYTNGNYVIIREIDHPENSDVYAEHSTIATVAKYSPSGFYIASADQHGKIRIWDTTQKEHILKNEFQPFIGIVKDLSWSFDNQRIVAVGEGREKFGHVFMAETGTSVGEISGHSRTINSCDFKPNRPMKIITGGEDNLVCYLKGPPFKFENQIDLHSKYVQTVRYSPTGSLFASGGFDGKIFLYNGDTMENVAELKGDGIEQAHAGGVSAVHWSPDGTKLLTASGDRTCKIFDVESHKQTTLFEMGSDLLDQQVSCLWQNNNLLSVSLSGFINYLDEKNSAKPIRVLTGHNKSITSIALDGYNLYTGGYDGHINYWNISKHENARVSGGHKNQVQDMAVSKSKQLVFTIGFDDTLRSIDMRTNEFTNLSVKLDSQPKGLCLLDNLIVIACYQHLLIFNEEGNKLATLKTNYEANCIASNPTNNHVAVGTSNNKVLIYKISSCGTKMDQLEDRNLVHRDAITCLEYSEDGKMLAVGDANRKIIVYDSNYQPCNKQEMGYHTARVNCVGWNPEDSNEFVSGSLDTALIVWDVLDPNQFIHYKKAHPLSQVNKVKFVNKDLIVSVGQDSNLKVWSLS